MIVHSDRAVTRAIYHISPFAFSGPTGKLCCTKGRLLERGNQSDLIRRIDQATGLIGGAFPFDKGQSDYLWQADIDDRITAVSHPFCTNFQSLSLEPSPEVYAACVEKALSKIGQDELVKVVLARTLSVLAEHDLPQEAIYSRLAKDDTITAFRVALPGADRALIGATPELLLRKEGAKVFSHPLAGSAPRSMDSSQDFVAREALSRSDKDHREHAIVVEYILDILSPFCKELRCPRGTEVIATASMWHLGTQITGLLHDPDMPSILLASLLHPTPAVCGLPSERAAALIKDIEPVDRAFYAGAVGYCDMARHGDGAWYVAIRCADICGASARLYAGAGIVRGSDPMAEARETGAKFGAMLQALGLPLDSALPFDRL